MKESENLQTSETQALNIPAVRQRLINWWNNINSKHEIIMIWWRRDGNGTPHKIGWRLFNGKLYIRYRNVA